MKLWKIMKKPPKYFVLSPACWPLASAEYKLLSCIWDKNGNWTWISIFSNKTLRSSFRKRVMTSSRWKCLKRDEFTIIACIMCIILRPPSCILVQRQMLVMAEFLHVQIYSCPSIRRVDGSLANGLSGRISYPVLSGYEIQLLDFWPIALDKLLTPNSLCSPSSEIGTIWSDTRWGWDKYVAW